MHSTQAALSRYVLLIGLALTCSITTANSSSHSADDAFREAVQAVKDRDYGRALKLFEQQANDAKHDAQYNMAVLLQAGKGQPRNYLDALYWGWLAWLGGIEEAEDLISDMRDALTKKDAEAVRGRVSETLQARLDNGDIKAIAQFADYHLSILVEPDYGTAYIWYSIAAALNIPEWPTDEMTQKMTSRQRNWRACKQKPERCLTNITSRRSIPMKKEAQMVVKVQWIIDGIMEIDAETNEAAEALANEKLRSFIKAHPELTETLGATAIQGHAVTDDDDA